MAASAAGLWEKLKDPVLAGPWRQLFAQVQSPRHVLSELLQNADDAGAKSASVRVVKNQFVFEHDGEDFNEEQFQSLCRFGYSNKRNLHTIGFRGVGFKSTFSLGDRVRIQTPTLDVYFDRDRFTLPVWSNKATPTARTRISVRFADQRRERQLRMNFEEWVTSPVSLLFFRNLQELTVESHAVRKVVIARGPIAGSQRIRLTGASTEELLLIRSEEEAFPEDVVSEIRQERNADDLHLPPCSVELVLGLDGDQRLFVVLPAGTDVDLPFSINAPFLQDPARQKIKEPEVSPCNRWLLERAGRLAGEAMVAWLGKEQLTAEHRAEAYGLLREPIIDAADLTTSATMQVMDAMLAAVADEPLILTTEDELAPVGECSALPSALHEVWDPKELTRVFAPAAEHLLSPKVSGRAVRALQAHGWIETISNETALELLKLRSVVPKPTTWARLQVLWNWVEENIGWDWNGERRRTLRIVPVEGQASLQPGEEVIRVSSRGQQLSEADWNFISNLAMAIDQEWIARLNKLKSKEDDEEQHAVLALLEAIGLHEPSPVDRIAAQASRRLVARDSIPEKDCVRIAHIFAALDATVPDDFRYATGAPYLQRVNENPIVFDAYGEVEALVPKAWAEQHLLLPDYVKEFKSCTKERWFEWAYSSKSKLHAFIPLIPQTHELDSRRHLGEFLLARGGENPKEYRYRNDRFVVDDFDFPPEIRSFWQTQTTANPRLWADVVKGMLLDPLVSWKHAFRVNVRQVSSQRTTGVLNCGSLVPAWLVKFRSLPCLTDRHGDVRTPAELLLRTAETETLLDLEPFVAAELDDADDKKALLRWLGVRDTSLGWEKVVERLRGLTKIKDTMRVLANVLRLYEALDRIALRCSAEDLNELRAVFAAEALVLSNMLEWFSSGELSLHADPEDDSSVVHSAAHGLGLWLRVGVPERPALEKSLEWLKTLATRTRLEGVSYKRATVALMRGGRRVWDELGHWLSLDQTWEAVATLKYRISKSRWIPWERLSTSTKQATADLRMLHGEVAEEAPFTVTRPLAEAITMQVTNVQTISGRARRMEWLQPLADGLSRVKLRDEAATAKVRQVARCLLNTTWQTVIRLEVTPYIDGTPVGEPLMPKVLWSDTKLYVADLPTVRLMRELKEELTRPFGEAQVMEAVADCIDRDAEFVCEYLAANFELDAQAELPPQGEQGQEPKEPELGEDEPEKEDQDGEATPDEAGVECGEQVEGRQDDPEPVGEEVPKRDKESRPKAPTFMDRYAKSRGFRWHENERCYTHANGAWIDKGEAPFNWQEHMNGDDVIKRLFVVEESLIRGVEIPYELWQLMQINPDTIALVLCDEDGEPNEMTATELRELKNAGQVHLHQSRFILKETI
ncbi:MAG TPA: ATP-binding protein [Verrucomicrobiae bacterium]|nr:ATP-binding protein [Verrucomicrobiae bacterium]